MDKITDFKGINKYYCSECESFHKKRTPSKIKQMKTTFILNNPNFEFFDSNENKQEIKLPESKFTLHKEFAFKLTSSELWKLQFNRSCQSYTIKKHKKSIGSNKR